MLTGERPEVNAGVAARLRDYGHEDFTSYVIWVCERALERGLLPHTNLGVLDATDLARLREVTASQGLMLESINPDLVVHQGSPTKHPARRLETIAAAGRAADPVHERDPRRYRRERGGAGRRARGDRRAARALWARPGGDPPELRPASELLRARAGGYRRRRRARVLAHGPGSRSAARRAQVGEPGLGGRHEAPRRRGAPADARRRHPGAPQPVGLVGRARPRGRDRPRRAERQRRPHLTRAPVPVADPGEKAPARRGRGADRAAVRVLRVHRPGVDLPARDGRDQDPLLVVHPAAGLGTAGRGAGRRRRGAASRGARPRRTRVDARGTDRAVRRATAGRDRGDARGRRRAAGGAGGGDGHVRRQPQHQRLQRVRRRLRLLRLRAVAALARCLRAQRGGVRSRVAAGGRLRRHRALHPVGHPPRLGARGLRALAARRQARRPAHPSPRLLADGDRAHVRRERTGAAQGVRATARGRAWARPRVPLPRCCTMACASG